MNNQQVIILFFVITNNDIQVEIISTYVTNLF